MAQHRWSNAAPSLPIRGALLSLILGALGVGSVEAQEPPRTLHRRPRLFAVTTLCQLPPWTSDEPSVSTADGGAQHLPPLPAPLTAGDFDLDGHVDV
ncbi:hypothetical protein ACFL6M_07550, partial [Candidatus Eisenbacteria bacterium]